MYKPSTRTKKGGSCGEVGHWTKFQISEFLKRDGNIELHVSVTFTFCVMFCKRIFNILVESLQRKPNDDGFMHLTILTRKLDLTINAVFPATGQGFKITK